MPLPPIPDPDKPLPPELLHAAQVLFGMLTDWVRGDELRDLASLFSDLFSDLPSIHHADLAVGALVLLEQLGAMVSRQMQLPAAEVLEPLGAWLARQEGQAG